MAVNYVPIRSPQVIKSTGLKVTITLRVDDKNSTTP
jgi:hypothetical protein